MCKLSNLFLSEERILLCNMLKVKVFKRNRKEGCRIEEGGKGAPTDSLRPSFRLLNCLAKSLTTCL